MYNLVRTLNANMAALSKLVNQRRAVLTLYLPSLRVAVGRPRQYRIRHFLNPFSLALQCVGMPELEAVEGAHGMEGKVVGGGDGGDVVVREIGELRLEYVLLQDALEVVRAVEPLRILK